MAKTTDPLFIEYAKTAPRLDLQSYIDHASRHINEYPEHGQTRDIIGEMASLSLSLKGTPASQKRQVWALIDRFKASIPQWYGNAGAWRDDEADEQAVA